MASMASSTSRTGAPAATAFSEITLKLPVKTSTPCKVEVVYFSKVFTKILRSEFKPITFTASTTLTFTVPTICDLKVAVRALDKSMSDKESDDEYTFLVKSWDNPAGSLGWMEIGSTEDNSRHHTSGSCETTATKALELDDESIKAIQAAKKTAPKEDQKKEVSQSAGATSKSSYDPSWIFRNPSDT